MQIPSAPMGNSYCQEREAKATPYTTQNSIQRGSINHERENILCGPINYQKFYLCCLFKKNMIFYLVSF